MGFTLHSVVLAGGAPPPAEVGVIGSASRLVILPRMPLGPHSLATGALHFTSVAAMMLSTRACTLWSWSSNLTCRTLWFVETDMSPAAGRSGRRARSRKAEAIPGSCTRPSEVLKPEPQQRENPLARAQILEAVMASLISAPKLRAHCKCPS